MINSNVKVLAYYTVDQTYDVLIPPPPPLEFRLQPFFNKIACYKIQEKIFKRYYLVTLQNICLQLQFYLVYATNMVHQGRFLYSSLKFQPCSSIPGGGLGILTDRDQRSLVVLLRHDSFGKVKHDMIIMNNCVHGSTW